LQKSTEHEKETIMIMMNVNNKYAAANATKTLNFIRKNLYKCSQSTKAKAYSSVVHPILEHCSIVWDLHFLKDFNELEKIQR